MTQIVDFLTRIIFGSSWPPAWYSGNWSNLYGGIRLLSDLIIFAACLVLAFYLARFILKKKINFNLLFWCFAFLILLIGAVHFSDIITLYNPAHETSAATRAGTAVMAVLTVVCLVKAFPQVTALKSPKEIQNEVAQRKAAEESLQRKARELERTNHELDEFVYNTSHNLRSPLSTVMGLINLAEADTDDPQNREYLQLMRQNVNDLDEFIHEIIEYSKNSRQDVSYAEVDFNDLYEQSLASLKYLENSSRVQCALLNNLSGPFISDGRRLQMILSTVLNNSIKYHDLSKNKPFARVEISESGNHEILIRIADNGLGIGRDAVPHVFKMFFRATDIGKGAGLGLYIVKQIVDKIGGQIRIISTLGVGTEMSIQLKNHAYVNAV